MAGIILLGVAYTFSQFYRSFLAILVPNLKHDLGVTSEDLSQAFGAFFVAFALMQLIVGTSLDKYGPRRTTSFLFGIFGTGGAALFGLAESSVTITISMALLGVGCSSILMSSIYIYARIFHSTRFALYSSILVGLGTMGNIIGATPLAVSIEMFGWRETLFALAGATLLISVIINMFCKDPSVPDTSEEDEEMHKGFRGTLQILKMPVIWVMVPILFVHYGVAAGSRGLWVGPYFEDIFDLSILEIGTVTLYMSVAMVIGTWIYGPLDKWLNTRKWVIFFGTALMAFCCAFLALNPTPSYTLAVLAFVGIGFMGMGFPVILAHGKSFVRPSMIGRGVTLLNFFSMGGAGLMQFITGKIYDVSSSATVGYQNVMTFYTLAMCIALFVYIFSKDAKPVPKP